MDDDRKRKFEETLPARGEAKPDSGENSVILLHVGTTVLETTTQTLLGRDEDSFFHAKLSGRWDEDEENDKNKRKITIDRDGMLFLDVMYYLRYGVLPGGHDYGRCKLSVDYLKRLKQEAEFYLLPGLVKLCTKASDPYRRFGSIGDFNDEDYMDFTLTGEVNHTRYATEIEYTIEYKYKGTTKVRCRFDTDGGDDDNTSIRVYNCDTYNNYLDNTSYCKSFEELKTVIAGGCKTVASAMEKVEIAPEAQLYMAFVINEMISYYTNYKDWDNSETGGDPLPFLYHDTTWGDFNFLPKEDDS